MLGRLIHFPMITIRAAKISTTRAVIARLKKADIILLTSRCGVKYFFEFLVSQKFSFDNLRSKSFVVIGAETEKQLGIYGFSANLIAKDETSEGLFVEIKRAFKLKGKSIIFPRSSLSNPYLKKNLQKTGAKVDEIVVYENIKPAKKELPKDKIDQVIFTSPSTLNNFLADYGQIPKEWTILAKGKRTQLELKKAGYSTVTLVSETKVY